MIDNIINELKDTIKALQNAIQEDIEDVKKANHDQLVLRNEVKLELMDNLQNKKELLNQELMKQYKDDIDISKYKDNIDSIEVLLRELYELNGKLASIVLPVKEMYKEIIEDITKQNGGSLVEVMA